MLDGNNDIVEILLSHENINVNFVPQCGISPLFAAAFNGHANVVKSLLSDPDIHINWVEERTGSTALIQAILHRHRPVVRNILRHHKIDVNVANRGGSALINAVVEGYPEMVRMLFKHSNIRVSILPLLIAAERGHDMIAKILLRHPDIVEALENDGFYGKQGSDQMDLRLTWMEMANLNLDDFEDIP